MSNRIPLLRMMFLVMFLIFVLIIYSTQLSKNSSINKNNHIFKKTIILKEQDKAYSVILHSIILNDDSIIGYSDKYDSSRIFPALDVDINIIKSKLDKLPFKMQDCNSCHNNPGIYSDKN